MLHDQGIPMIDELKIKKAVQAGNRKLLIVAAIIVAGVVLYMSVKAAQGRSPFDDTVVDLVSLLFGFGLAQHGFKLGFIKEIKNPKF